MGHAFGRCSFKLMSNESESPKKKCSLSIVDSYFFFNRSLKLAHLHLFWPVMILKLMSNVVQLGSKIHDVDRPMYPLFTKFYS